MILRRLTRSGIEQFAAFLDSLRTDDPLFYPANLLDDDETSQIVVPTIETEMRSFGTRFQLAEFLDTRLGDAPIMNLDRDTGLWTWLALFYFNQLCQTNSQGQQVAGQRARWIYRPSARRYYVHLVAGPFLVYRLHKDCPDRVQPLLHGRVSETNPVYDELASRPELLTNQAVLDVASRLYFDRSCAQLKPGATRKNGGGTIYRLVDVLTQFQATWDLYSIDADTLYWILPEEFDRFRG